MTVGYHRGMTVVDTEDRLADALRTLVVFAVDDCPEWAPKDALAARHVAYTRAVLALDEYDQSHIDAPSHVGRLLPGAEDAPALALAA